MEYDGFVAIAFGLALIVLRRHIAEQTIKVQNDIFKFGFGEKSVKLSEFICLVLGVFAIIQGLLEIFKS